MAVDVLKERGVPEDRILFLNLIASPEGIERFSAKFPKLHVITAFIDQVCALPARHPIFQRHPLTSLLLGPRREKVCYFPLLKTYQTANHPPSYIVPGLGDFGDRFFTM